MNTKVARLLRSCALIAVLLMLAAGVPIRAAGPFVESDVIVLHTFRGENIGDGFGWVGAALGDLDGDGAGDFLITAPWNGENTEGKVYVYSGADGTVLNEVSGVPGNLFGYSATSAGDVDGDGVPDYIAGGPGAGGRAIVYSGTDHSVLLDLSETSEEEAFGISVAGAGDVDGDARGDLIVGATQFNASETVTQTGKIYLLSGLDGSVIWTHEGETPQGQLGGGVGMVGDVNDDSVPDQVAAATGDGDDGLAYVFSGADGTILHTLEPVDTPQSGGTFGRFFASSAGDVDGDGLPDIYLGDYAAFREDAAGTGRAYIYSGADGAPIHIFEAESDGDGLGPGRGIPDVDGDGIADVIVAAWTSSAGAPQGGKVYLHAGADGALLRTVTGAIEGDSLGVDALSIGDVNGDGHRDYLLTSVGSDFNGTDVGKAYVVSFMPDGVADFVTFYLRPLLSFFAAPGQ